LSAPEYKFISVLSFGRCTEGPSTPCLKCQPPWSSLASLFSLAFSRYFRTSRSPYFLSLAIFALALAIRTLLPSFTLATLALALVLPPLSQREAFQFQFPFPPSSIPSTISHERQAWALQNKENMSIVPQGVVSPRRQSQNGSNHPVGPHSSPPQTKPRS
jgi:hypothetical protein